MTNVNLDALRDIHLPPDPGIWPPAIGWWMCLIVLIALAAMTPRFIKRVKRFAIRRRTIYSWRQLQRRARDVNDVGVMADLSLLIREVAVARYSARECAALTGQAWLEFLSRTADGIDFDNETGRRLLDAPYRREHNADSRAIIDLAGHWLHKNA